MTDFGVILCKCKYDIGVSLFRISALACQYPLGYLIILDLSS